MSVSMLLSFFFVFRAPMGRLQLETGLPFWHFLDRLDAALRDENALVLEMMPRLE